MPKPDLVNAYHGNQGVPIKFMGTNIHTTFGWKSIFDLKDDILFFGPPLDLSRNYNLLFRKGRDPAAYITKIYWAMTRETYGDHFKSSCLNMAFNKRYWKYRNPQLKKPNRPTG